MQKKSWVFVCYAFITGAFSMFLRWLQLKNCFEKDTGLFIGGSALTVVFVLMLLIAAAGLWVISRFVSAGAPPENALHARSPLCAVFSAVLSAVMFIGAVLLLFSCADMRAAMLFRLLAVLGLAAAASMFVAVSRMANGKPDSVSCFCFTVIVLFYCLWLIAAYKAHDSDPIIWGYAPEILAIAAGTLAWYFLAGFAFGKARPACAVFFSGLSFVLALTSMPDERAAALSLLLIAPALETLMLSWMLLNSSQAKVK